MGARWLPFVLVAATLASGPAGCVAPVGEVCNNPLGIGAGCNREDVWAGAATAGGEARERPEATKDHGAVGFSDCLAAPLLRKPTTRTSSSAASSIETSIQEVVMGPAVSQPLFCGTVVAA